MKKILALVLCALMMLMPLATAEGMLTNETTVTLQLADGTEFTAAFGVVESGDLVIKVQDVADLMIGKEAMYASVSGMVLSLNYAEIPAMIEAAGLNANIEGMEVDPQIVLDLMSTIGMDLLGFVQAEEDGSAMVLKVNFTAAELWDACGADITAWMTENSELIDSALAASGQEMTTADVVGMLEQIAPQLEALDMSIAFEVRVDLEAGLDAAVNGSVTLQGQEMLSLNVVLNMTDGLAVKAAAAGEEVSFAVKIVDANTLTVSVNGEEMARLTVTEGTAPIEGFDVSSAIPASALLNMLMSQEG